MLSVVDGVAVVDVVVVAIADVVAGGVADVVLLMLMFILLMSLSLMLAFLCWCWWVDVFVVVAVDDGVLLLLRAVVHVVFLDCIILGCFCRVEARRGEQELHGTPGERAGAAFCPGGGAGREDGNGQPPVHGNVLPPGVSSARQPSTAGGNLSPQRRRRRDTKLRVYAGHDPGADNGAGASAAAGGASVSGRRHSCVKGTRRRGALFALHGVGYTPALLPRRGVITRAFDCRGSL